MDNALWKYALPLLLLAATGGWAQEAEEDKSIPCGEIVSMRLVARDAFTLEWDARKFKDEPVCEKGEKFAIVMVRLGPNKSIGKYDYTLAGNQCLAMAINPNAFNPLNWEFRDLQEAQRVELLYKVKAAEDANGYPFLYKYVAQANIFAGKNAGCVSRTINSRSGGGGGAAERPGKDVDPDAAAKKTGFRAKGKKGKKTGDDDDDAAAGGDDEAAGGEEEEAKPAKKKKGDEGDGEDAEKPAKKKADDEGAAPEKKADDGGKKKDDGGGKKKDDWGL
jgi:hypothetical protein